MHESNEPGGAIPFSKFENFGGRIIDISRKYMGATRPFPLLTNKAAARTSFLRSISPRSSAVVLFLRSSSFLRSSYLAVLSSSALCHTAVSHTLHVH